MKQVWGRVSFVVILMLVFQGNALANPAVENPPELTASELKKLLPSLRKGGYVIYFRHASTDHRQEDQRPVDLNNCTTQRPLSEKGRQQAIAIGKAFKRLAIPVGKVLSSPFCRCRDTARLAFKNVKTSDDLFFAMGLKRTGKKRKGEVLKKMFTTPPAKHKNSIIVSHTANLQEALGLWPKPEGVAYIFNPSTSDPIQPIARVRPETWSQVK